MKGFNSRYARIAYTYFSDIDRSQEKITESFNSLYGFYKYFDKVDKETYIRSNHMKYINNRYFNIPVKFKKKK